MPFRPTKLLSVTMSDTAVSATFPTDDGWEGYPYQWTTTLAVTTLPHGSKYTRLPYYYNGQDVAVGDCIVTSSFGRCLKIVSIQSATDDTVNCTVEDYNRENIMSDQTQSGDGGIPDGDGFLFEVVNAFPILHPVPDALAGTLPPYFSADIVTRFLNNIGNNSRLMYVNQVAHGFSVGDPVYLWQDVYYKANASDIDYGHVDGVVVVTGVPDANRFGMVPTGVLVEGVTMPAGDSGTVVYIDVLGNLTTVKPTTGVVVPMYVKISATSGFYIGGMQAGTAAANTTNFDNTTAQFQGSPTTVQQALEAVTQFPLAPKTQYMSGYSGYSGVVLPDTEIVFVDWCAYGNDATGTTNNIWFPATTGSGRTITVAVKRTIQEGWHTPGVNLNTVDASFFSATDGGGFDRQDVGGIIENNCVEIHRIATFTDNMDVNETGYSNWVAVRAITDDQLLTVSGYSGFSGESIIGQSGFSGVNGTIGTSGFSGSNGTSGFSGVSGYSGRSGYSGAAGESGFSGANGTNGASGFSGWSGLNGPIGTSGYSGTSGFSGLGVSGFSGSNGTNGASGFSGISGFSGSGISGYSGAQGTSGFSGYSGEKGDPGGGSGYSGFSGEPGGTSGYSGFSGSGVSGYSGETGSNGVSGFSGFSGTNGAAGTSGYSGAQGASGFSGTGAPTNAVVEYEFGINFTAANPTSFASMPSGWSGSISGQEVTVYHGAGKQPICATYWGYTATGTKWQQRYPTAANQLWAVSGYEASQFKFMMSNTIAGADSGGYAKIFCQF